MNTGQLLHPEELSNEELVHILNSLNIPVSAENSRGHLLHVFKRVAMPLPQRRTKSIKNNFDNIDSTKRKNFNECDILKSQKREQTFYINHIVNNTKKMKLNDGWPESSWQKHVDVPCLSENHNTVVARPENLKRRISMHLPEDMKRMKLKLQF